MLKAKNLAAQLDMETGELKSFHEKGEESNGRTELTGLGSSLNP